MESQKPHKHRLRDSERLFDKKGEELSYDSIGIYI